MPQPTEQRSDLLLAVEEGNAERVFELLDEISTESPNLIDKKAAEVLFAVVAEQKHEQILARLLRVRPAIINDYDYYDALSLAAGRGNHAAMAQLLAADPLVPNHELRSALHSAAKAGQDQVVAQLLAFRPLLPEDEIAFPWPTNHSTLHLAVENGHEAVFAQLLAACPRLIDTLGGEDVDVLHCAVNSGHDNLATQILNLRPEMANNYTCEGQSALGRVIDDLLFEMRGDVLASNKTTPTLAAAAAAAAAARAERKLQLAIKLFQINPHALFYENVFSESPFLNILSEKREDLVELLMWRASFHDFATTTTMCYNFKVRYRPLMEQQCESLVALMNRDVLSIIFEYIGFEPIKRISNLKRPFLTPNEFKCPVQRTCKEQ